MLTAPTCPMPPGAMAAAHTIACPADGLEPIASSDDDDARQI